MPEALAASNLKQAQQASTASKQARKLEEEGSNDESEVTWKTVWAEGS